MRGLLVLGGLGFLGLLLSPTAAAADGLCLPKPCLPHVEWQEKTVTRYRTECKTHVREVPVTVMKPRFETVEKDFTYRVAIPETKEVVRERRVPVTTWKEEKHERTVMHTEWKTETRERTVMVPEWREETKTRTYTVMHRVPEKVEREVECRRPKITLCCDPCTGCLRLRCEMECYTRKVCCTTYKCVPERKTETVKCRLPHYVAKKETCQVRIPVCKPVKETHVVKVPVCEYKVETYKVPVTTCRYETKTEKRKVRVCTWEKVTEMRKETCVTRERVPYECKVRVPVLCLHKPVCADCK